MKLFNLGSELYCVQSGVFLTTFEHRLFLLYLLNLIMCKRAGKISARTLCFMRQSNFRPSYFFNNDAYFFLDFYAKNCPWIFIDSNSF